MSTQKASIMELVVYHIKPEVQERYGFLLELARREVRSFPGIMGYDTFQSVKSPNTFVDLVYWNSKEEAETAAAQIMQKAALKPWTEAFEKIEFMDHLTFFK